VEFDPSDGLTFAFGALSFVVVAIDVLFVGLAVHRESPAKVCRWAFVAGAAGLGWLALHAGIAESGILVGSGMPPPVMPYFVVTMLLAVVLAFSGVGRRLAALPIGMLVGLHAFRLPLEWLLHELYLTGELPVQMTWSGYNFDVVTGVSALLIASASLRLDIPRWVYLAWNVVGLLLLVNVVTIALLSAPLPFRQFMEGPPVVLVYHAPFNWILNVHVFTALVGHLVLFRALRRDAS
jgi:hypothetical protein